MRNLRQYWQEIRAIQASLPEFLWIADELGRLVEVTAEIAAKLLHAKSHRVATEEEIAAHLGKSAAEQRDTAAEARRRRGVEVVPLK